MFLLMKSKNDRVAFHRVDFLVGSKYELNTVFSLSERDDDNGYAFTHCVLREHCFGVACDLAKGMQ